MPIYEYRCQSCDRRFSHLHGVVADEPALQCPRCHGTDLKRLISRVARVRSEDEMLDSLDPSRFGDLEDPASLRHKSFENIWGLGDAGNTTNASGQCRVTLSRNIPSPLFQRRARGTVTATLGQIERSLSVSL